MSRLDLTSDQKATQCYQALQSVMHVSPYARDFANLSGKLRDALHAVARSEFPVVQTELLARETFAILSGEGKKPLIEAVGQHDIAVAVRAAAHKIIHNSRHSPI